MKALKTFVRLVWTAPRGQVLMLLTLMILAGLTDGIGLLMLVPLLELLGGSHSGRGWVQQLLNVVQSVGLSPGVGGLLTVFVGLVAVRSGVQYAREQLGTRLQHGVVDQLRLRCFAALLGVEWRWLVNTRRSDHANLLLTDVSRVGVGLNFGLSLLATGATLIAYLLVALTLSWYLTLVALASGVLVFALLSGQRRKALKLGHSLTVASRSLHNNVQESLAGIKLAKILGTEARHLTHFTQTTEQLRAQQLQFSAGSSLSRALFQLGGAALLAGYVLVGLSILHTPAPELLTLVLVFSRLIPQFMAAQQQFDHCLHALPAVQQTEELLGTCLADAEPRGAANPESWPVNQAISLQNVSVRYADRQQPALNGLSVQFAAHTTTAIIGASGAGKSTLADVLMGLLSPDTGLLVVDGVPITGVSRHAWRQHVAYVPQDAFLFHDSIRHNLLWGQPDATDEALRLALQNAAADFVYQLPQGIDTVVGDGGVRLSGGERQRIALARALLKKPSLLILDEATSALDVDNEARIRRAIEQLHGDLTVVIIGHRLPTLEHADQVLVLEAGGIRAHGTWAQVRQLQENSSL
nr:ABC transporter ATP-binding protein [uncultured Rhodoferax sp.]